MSGQKDKVDKIFEALRAMADCSFPMECSCGEVYGDLHDFLKRTERTARGEHGLFEPTEHDDRSVTHLLRNCPACGSTLMAVFSERRDASEAGDRRRALFDQVVQLLCASGVPVESAKTELRAVLRGAESTLLQEHLMGGSREDLTDLLAALAGERDD